MRHFFFGLAVFALAAPMPLWAETTDREIAQHIISHLKSQKESGALKGFNLDLQVENGTVYLKGFVSKREQRRKAVEAARHVEGVKQVFNTIEIRQPNAPAPKPRDFVASTENNLDTPPRPPQVAIEMTPEDEKSTLAIKPPTEDRKTEFLAETVVKVPVLTNPVLTNSSLASSNLTTPATTTPIVQAPALQEPILSNAPINVFRTPRPIEVVNEQPIAGNEPAHVGNAREITEAIVSQYRTAMKSGDIQGFGIEVQVKEGVVWLKGTVSNQTQLDYAIDVARDVRGVTKIVNALGITPSHESIFVSHDGSDATDREIAQHIISHLKSQKESGALKGFNLDLQVENGTVYLKGFVSKREQRRKAVEAARHVEGVKQVFNTIEIRQPNAPAPKPRDFVASTENNLDTPPRPPQVAIEMTPEDEKSTLAIKPPTEDRKTEFLAETVVKVPVLTNPVLTNSSLASSNLTTPATTTPIVQAPALQEPILSNAPINVFRTPRPIEVVNEQPIAGNEPAHVGNAREITEAIVSQYRTAMKSGDIQGFGIEVQVKEGVVWLKGTVSNQTQLDYAIDVARDVRGVTKIVNALGITPSHESIFVSHDGSDAGVQHAFRQESSLRASDAESELIAKKVIVGLQKKKHEGLLTNFGIDVQVDQRTVWMSGYVKNSEQHAVALDVARYIPGVEMVVNDLKIKGPVATAFPQQRMFAQQAMGQQMMNYQMVPVQYMPVQAMQASNQMPMAFAPARPVNHTLMMQQGQPVPMTGNAGVGIAPARFDHPQMPGYAWPSYAPAPNYGAVTYPKQYSPSAWPYIGPFYPYPQVPLGWRRVTLEWDDGWWNLKFKNTGMH
jgi:osmotically-inducible protein OsmY